MGGSLRYAGRRERLWAFRGSGQGRGRGRGRRDGVASVLAMLYLMIFSTLALGFYHAVTTSAQVAHNDERALAAQVAAESGLQFLRYQLSTIQFPNTTPSDKIFQKAYDGLSAQTLLTPNMGGYAVAMAGNTIYFPASADDYYIPINGTGAGFRATLTDMGPGVFEKRTVRIIKAKVVGRHRGSKMARALEMEFMADYKTLSIFDYGIATRGLVSVGGSGGVFGPSSLEGSILTTSSAPTPVNVSATVAGELLLTSKTGNVALSNSASVGGTTTAEKWNYVRKGVDEPEFPIVDSTPFRAFATNPYKDGQTVYRNTFIPANTNPNFSGETTIEGVMYVQHPNQLKFVAKATIKGIIIVENGARPGPANSIHFGGGIDAFGMDVLPDTSDFPASMKKLRGSVLLAPGFAVSLRGSAGTIGGTMLAESFDFGGGSGGIVKGNIIGMGPGGFNLGGQARIDRTRADEVPSGMILTVTFKPRPGTYLEVRP